MDREERLAALSSFFGCSPAEAEPLSDAMTFVVYRHDQALIQQGDLGAKVWIVLKGQAQLKIIGSDGQVQLLMTHGPGELFGALPHERIFVSDVVARDNIAVLEISSREMNALVQDRTRLGSGLAVLDVTTATPIEPMVSLRIPTKPAMHSGRRSDLKPATS